MNDTLWINVAVHQSIKSYSTDSIHRIGVMLVYSLLNGKSIITLSSSSKHRLFITIMREMNVCQKIVIVKNNIISTQG